MQIDYISVIKMHFGTNLPAGRFGGRTAHAPAILEDAAPGEKTDGPRQDRPINSMVLYMRKGVTYRVGAKGRVVGIDHIKELVDDSVNNVKKDDPLLLSSGRVNLFDLRLTK
ncbi:unnamed protein product [Ranitomeya imitator]|uniref:Uncharacterized protein n=1 Tax=Ranitomeya imitator TaxID=111125 RepID=A0ABN9LCF3_9NEOB|nr:unnamed protein product [Ranitomeya imitator]